MVSFESMLIGFTDAVSRFVDAAKSLSQDPTATRNALFEALNWAVALDERVARYRAPDGESLGWKWREQVGHGAEVMGGVRFARNSVHHQWSEAMRLDPGGMSFPMTFPVVFFEWVWRPADELPKPDKKPRPEDEAVYRRQMEGRPVRVCLDVLNGAFYWLRQVLEPDTIRQKLEPGDDEALQLPATRWEHGTEA